MPPKGQTQTVQPGVYYVNFPKYNISPSDKASVPVGHAGLMIVNQDGTKTYYEYGQYDNNIYGQTKEWDGKNITEMPGNWRSTNLNGLNLEDIAQELFTFQGDPAGNDVRFTHVESDPEATLKFITDDANNLNRNNYSLTRISSGIKNCGSQASAAISAGLDKGTDFRNKLIATTRRNISPFIPGRDIIRMLAGKGASSNTVLNAILGTNPATKGITSLINTFLGENTTTDFEDRYALNKTYSFKRR